MDSHLSAYSLWNDRISLMLAALFSSKKLEIIPRIASLELGTLGDAPTIPRFWPAILNLSIRMRNYFQNVRILRNLILIIRIGWILSTCVPTCVMNHAAISCIQAGQICQFIVPNLKKHEILGDHSAMTKLMVFLPFLQCVRMVQSLLLIHWQWHFGNRYEHLE